MKCGMIFLPCGLHSVMSQDNKIPLCMSLNCGKCNSCLPSAPWLMDSGASKHFTMNLDEFSSYESIPANSTNKVITTNGETFIEGKGTVFLQHNVERNSQVIEQWTMCLSPIYYISGLSSWLMSMGEFLHSGLEVQESAESLELIEKHGKIAIQCLSVQRLDTIYWVKTQTVMPAKANVTTIHVADYEIWHKQLGHVSPKALSKMPTSTQKFPQVQTLKFIPICPGCAQGKMKSRSFLELQFCAMRLLELIHSDLKFLPVESFHWFKYFIVFIDDKSLHMWTANLRKKSGVSKAIKNFKAMARIQHGATIKRWWINQGGEFINSNLMDTLKGLGITIEQSIPHQHQQNRQAERAIRTIMEKAQCLHFTACLPQSWWEFCVNHTVHLINWTLIAHLSWQTC